ncbi:MAG: prominin family protein [Oscillospiraceae bacterium]|nr:prominin family protein [Oscillospiraceae bacterium]
MNADFQSGPSDLDPLFAFALENQDPNRGKGKATAALVLGLIATFFPVPVLGSICGIIGLVMAHKSKQEGCEGCLRTAGFVMAVIGTVVSTLFALIVVFYFMVFAEQFGYMGEAIEWFSRL